MNYFKKTKFRETSLIFVAVFIAIIYFTISDSSEEDELDVQALIDAAVDQAVEEALANASSVESTTTTTASTTTTIPASEGDSAEGEPQDLPDSAVPARKIEGEVSTFGESYDQSRYSLIRGAWISTGLTKTIDATYDAFIIKVEKTSDYDLLPGPYMVKKGGNPCITDEGGCKVPDDFEEYLWIRGSFSGYEWTAPNQITNQDSKLVAKYYGTFEGESDFLLKIEPGATFRSYRWDDLIVIEVEKITPLTFTDIKKTLPDQIFRGYVEEIYKNENKILIDDEIYAEINSSTSIYFNGIKVDTYDFKADKSEYVHAVFNDPVMESLPAQGTASAIYIKKRGNTTSGFVTSAKLNDIE